MKRMSFVLMTALALAGTSTAIAQQGTTTTQMPPPPGQGQGRGTSITTAQQGFGSLASLSNIRLELTITDQSAAGQPVKKVITLLLAERGNGRVRSGGEVYRAGTENAPGSQYVPVTLNADANVGSVEGDRVRVFITVEYMPATSALTSAHRVSQLNQSVDVVLSSGKPTLIVESADPTSDRKVTLHATATIVR